MKLKKPPLICRIRAKVYRSPSRIYSCALMVKPCKYCNKCEGNINRKFWALGNELRGGSQ